MSPGRHVIPSPSTDRISVTSNARRSLNFGWDTLRKAYKACITVNYFLWLIRYYTTDIPLKKKSMYMFVYMFEIVGIKSLKNPGQ